MATVNIPSTLTDPNYRYKMPKLMSKVEGRGNGIKTNIMNMGEIAKALKRPPEYPTKFFGCELGALSKYENKEEKAIVNGAHEQLELQKLIDKFIEKFVLCPLCSLPEMDLLVKKNVVSGQCNACGNFCNLDNLHRVATYIMNHPPGGGDSTMGKKLSKKAKDEKAKDKELKREKTAELHSDNEKDLESSEKKEKKKKDKNDKKEKHRKKSKSDDDTVDGMSPTAGGGETVVNDATEGGHNNGTGEDSAKKSKKNKETRGVMQNEALNYDSEEIGEICARLREVVNGAGSPGTFTPSDLFQEVRLLQVSQMFNSKIRMFVSFDALFSPEVTPADIKERKSFLLKLVDASVSVADVCSALETFVVTKRPHLLRDFPSILQILYNADVLNEGTDLVAYYDMDPTDTAKMLSSPDVFTKARAAGKPFLDALKEDLEGEDESSSESDEADAVTPSMRGPALKSLNLDADKPTFANLTLQPNSDPPAVAPVFPEDESESDLDIDAI